MSSEEEFDSAVGAWRWLGFSVRVKVTGVNVTRHLYLRLGTTTATVFLIFSSYISATTAAFLIKMLLTSVRHYSVSQKNSP